MAPLPVQSTVARIRTVEFFGVLLPGLYVMSAIGFAFVSAGARDWGTLSSKLKAALAVDPKWLPTIAVLFASYIMGSMVRAFPVDSVDRRIGGLVRWIRGLNPKKDKENAQGSMLYLLYGSDFPYQPWLEHHHALIVTTQKYLNSSAAVQESLKTGILPGDFRLHVVFDFWKAWLYAVEPDAGSHIQESEARTRMFCGMFWACIIAFIVSAVGSIWSHMCWVSACVSALIVIMCAWRLRHIRGEEARQIFFSYIVNESRKGTQKTHAEQPPHAENSLGERTMASSNSQQHEARPSATAKPADEYLTSGSQTNGESAEMSKEERTVSTSSILLEQYKIAENRRTTFGKQFMQTTGFVGALFSGTFGLVGAKNFALIRPICVVGGLMFLAVALLGHRLGQRQDDCERTLSEIEDALVASGHTGIVRQRKGARFGARIIIMTFVAGFGAALIAAGATTWWIR